MKLYTVSFFGHRTVPNVRKTEQQLYAIIRSLLLEKEYVEFLVGRNGEFDSLAASVIRQAKRNVRGDNSSLSLILPYPIADYCHNKASYESYYDTVELCDDASHSHFKAAIGKRNQAMIDRSDLILCFVEKAKGGAYQAVKYALRQGKPIQNLCPDFPITP